MSTERRPREVVVAATERDPAAAVELTVWAGGGRVRMLVPCEAGETEVEMEPAQAAGLADALLAHAGGPPLLPPLTAVQRAWVSAVAAMLPSEHRRQLHAWAVERWGVPRWATLDRIATAVWQFRIEGGGGRDAV